MKRLIAWILLALILTACGSSQTAERTAPEPVTETTTEATTEPETEPETAPETEPPTEPTAAPTTEPTYIREVQVSRDYVLNTSTKKIHTPDCKSVSEMKPKNRRDVTSTLDELKGQGYAPCGKCHPY